MRRRSFCKLATGATIGAGLPPQFVPGLSRASLAPPDPPGFRWNGRSYADLCATPAERRVFYALQGRTIVHERLEEAQWRPTGYGDPPALPQPGGSQDGVPMQAPMPGLAGEGPFAPTWNSLREYECPEWYRDAKFAIWNHWSPQCVPEDGDWYARNLYEQGSPQSRYHTEHYGHPSRFGYKELCAQWTLLDWEPEYLMGLYKRAGARIFFALANHHDGFDTWNSTHHPWNAQNLGPRRDVIGTWSRAARRQGLRFGVTVHQARNWWWFQTAHGADKTGPFAGIPYDGRLTLADGKGEWWENYDPQRLYGVKHPFDALPDAAYVKNFYDRTRDLVDQHDPDVLYFDNSMLPLGWGGLCVGAYFYNRSLARHGGKVDGVINVKDVPDALLKAVVADVERGLRAQIATFPWQSETCIGQWHYQRTLPEQPGEFGGYMHPREAIHWLIDTVSKNGTFVLNIPGKPDGTIDRKETLILEKIGAWLAVNGDAIYASRPWKVHGEGPVAIRSGSFHGESIQALSAKDVRYTRNKAATVVYAIALGWPEGTLDLRSLGSDAPTKPGRVAHVDLLGTALPVSWQQTATSLRVTLPSYRPETDYAATLRVRLAS